MLFNAFRGFNAADAAVSEWCANKFPGDLAMQAKCSQNSFPMSLSPPWTDLGAILRGIPKNSLLVDLATQAQGGGTVYSPPPVAPASGDGIFGIPNTIMIVGGGVLAIGLGALVLSRRKRHAVSGYGRSRRRRSKRSRR